MKDIYDLAAAWATAAIMENELINDAAHYAAKHLDAETAKFITSVVLLVVPEIGDHFDIEMIKEFNDFTQDPDVGDLVETAIDNAIDLAAEITEELQWQKDDRELEALEAEFLEADIRSSKLLETEIREAEALEAETLEAGIRADAEKAAAAIEELSGKLEEVTQQEPRESEQEIADLMQQFEAERQERIDKIDQMENAYFEKYPDLDENQRGDAEERFEEIRKGEMESLGEQQEARLEQLMTDQQEQRDNFAEARKELEETRDERS
jgi:hypothetical protein